jgi:hypothetical protein
MLTCAAVKRTIQSANRYLGPLRRNPSCVTERPPALAATVRFPCQSGHGKT